MPLFRRLRAVGTGVRRVLGVVERVRSALFATGGDMQLPGNTPTDPPITVSVPTGILRDHANQSIIISIIFKLVPILNMTGVVDINLPFTEEQANTTWLVISASFDALAGVFRTKSRVITRG